jgi:hypothetical protein
MKEKVEFFLSSSTKPNICITAISTNLKNPREKCRKMQKASEIYHKWVKGLAWNGASIAIATLICIVNLKGLDYMSRTFVDRINGQILVTIRGELASKVLKGSNSFSE